MDKIPAIILAGRPPKRDKLMEAADVDYKVLIKYKGKSLIDICLEAVIPIASHILIVGISPDLVNVPEGFENIEFLEMEGEQYDKIHAAAVHMAKKKELFNNGRHVLFVSGDLPLIRTDIIEKFLKQTSDRQFDFYYSVVPEKIFLEYVPEFEWRYMKIRDGKFAAGNLVLLDPSTVVDKYEIIKFLSTNRKSFVKGVLKASPIMFLKLIFGRIRVPDAEKLMTKMFGITSKIVIFDHFEISFDLDAPEHLDWLEKYQQKNS